MLQKEDLLLIRATLQFWYEEMDLEDPEMLAIYSGSPRIIPKWKNADIQQLRQQLLTARLRYVVCRHDAASVKTPRLFNTLEAASKVMPDASDRLGVVLVTDPVV